MGCWFLTGSLKQEFGKRNILLKTKIEAVVRETAWQNLVKAEEAKRCVFDDN